MTPLRSIAQAPGRAAAAWHRFWFLSVDPYVLILFRVALGAFLTLYYLMLAPSWLLYYGPDAIAPAQLRPLSDFTLFTPSPLLYISTNWGVLAFYGCSLLAACSLTLGRFGRIPLLWLWMSNAAIMYRNVGVSNAEEQVMAVLLFYSLFLPLTHSSRGPAGPGRGVPVTVWALRLVQVHFALIYLLSFPWKLITDFAWRDGTVIYYAMNSVLFARWPGQAIFVWADALLSRVLTFVTLALELFFPLLVWWRPWRMPLTLGLIILHIGIGAVLEGVGMFNFAMVVGLILFLPSRRTREGLERLAQTGNRLLKALRGHRKREPHVPLS